MSTKRENMAIVGVGAAACAACCVGPIVGFLAAIGLGTVVGVALFGTTALAFGALAAAIVVRRRRRAQASSTLLNQASVVETCSSAAASASDGS